MLFFVFFFFVSDFSCYFSQSFNSIVLTVSPETISSKPFYSIQKVFVFSFSIECAYKCPVYNFFPHCMLSMLRSEYVNVSMLTQNHLTCKTKNKIIFDSFFHALCLGNVFGMLKRVITGVCFSCH